MTAVMEQHEIEIAFAQHFEQAESYLVRIGETEPGHPSTVARLRALADGHAALALAAATLISGQAIAEATRQSEGMR